MNNPAFALIGEHKHERGQSVTVRLAPVVHRYLAAMAEDNGRSVSDEIRAALEVHVSLHRLSLVLDQETQESRKTYSNGLHGTTGDAARGLADVLRRDVSEAWAASFPSAYRVFERQFPEFLWKLEV